MKKYWILLLATTFPILAPSCKKDDPDLKPTVIEASGSIQAAITEYKALLGADNGGEPGTQGTSGFREINWDGLTDAESAPNLYAPDLFNSPTAPRARGIVISTPGTGLMVSADSSNSTSTPKLHLATSTRPTLLSFRPSVANGFFRRWAATSPKSGFMCRAPIPKRSCVGLALSM